ncbi:MAG TPA: Fe-S cluster assembly protein SufD, partial [Nocardioides sp.]
MESHLNPPASYDLEDHPVPSGREEIWRFTPLKRLRGILDGAASEAHLTWETTVPDGVTLREVAAEEVLALGELAPNDRPSALAAANAGRAMLLEVPAEAAIPDPVVLHLHGESVEDLVWGRLLVRVGANADVTIV